MPRARVLHVVHALLAQPREVGSSHARLKGLGSWGLGLRV